MPVPEFCPNPGCRNHVSPRRNWRIRYGLYTTTAHGTVQRYRCRDCGSTVSSQTESLHYYSKRRLPLRAVTDSFCAGASVREIARRYGFSAAAVHNALVRIGRQCMAAHIHLLNGMNERDELAIDGFRSFVTSQDYPCDITAVVDAHGETILTMTHSVFARGGRMTPRQTRRIEAKYAVWRPERGRFKKDISLLVRELWDYTRPRTKQPILIDTDEQPTYKSVLATNRIVRHFKEADLFYHRTTPGNAPRTKENPLFPVNYVDRLLRHRVKEHMRETIAFGRNATMQMHRAWIFAWDHNVRREYRVRNPEDGVHAGQCSVPKKIIPRLQRGFFTRRMRIVGLRIPESIRRVWLGKLPTPPVRWRLPSGSGGTHRIPEFARREIAAA